MPSHGRRRLEISVSPAYSLSYSARAVGGQFVEPTAATAAIPSGSAMASRTKHACCRTRTRRENRFRIENQHHRQRDRTPKTLRMAMLINGGAAISVLAFIGGLASRDKVPRQAITQTAPTIVWFASGVAATLSMGLAYFTNLYVGLHAGNLPLVCCICCDRVVVACYLGNVRRQICCRLAASILTQSGLPQTGQRRPSRHRR